MSEPREAYFVVGGGVYVCVYVPALYMYLNHKNIYDYLCFLFTRLYQHNVINVEGKHGVCGVSRCFGIPLSIL